MERMKLIFCLALFSVCHESQGVEPQMPRFLGKFDVAHAGFVEVFDREDGGKDLYITSFNAALPFFHDPVFFLRDPGNFLSDVASWPDHLSTLGTKATAYWPNFPVQVPKDVLGFEAVVQTSGFLVPTFGDPISQLIWLKNPGTAPPAPGQNWDWQWFLASEGPDVYFEEQVFEVCNPDCFEYSAIVTAELWTERVMIYFVVNEPGAWGHPG